MKNDLKQKIQERLDKHKCDGSCTEYIMTLIEQRDQERKKKIENMLIPESDLRGDDLMHYEEGYSDAIEDALKLL